MKHVHMAAEGAGGAPATEGRLIHWASRYDLFVTVFSLGQAGALRRRTVEVAGVRPGDRVLDVGCGTGDLTFAAAARAGSGGEVAGIDASPEMIEVARKKAARKAPPVRFEVGLIERIPFPEGYFDVALSSLMLHHLPGQLKHDGLAEVYRVLKPGGRLLIVDMRTSPAGIGRSFLVATGHGFLVHPSAGLPDLLQGAGFWVEKTGRLVGGILEYASGIKEG